MSKYFKVDFAHKLNVSSQEIREFIEKNWLRQTLLSDEQFYNWQFCQPIANEQKDHTIIAMLDSNIVGFLGLNKRSFVADGKALNGAELATWIINDDYQGRGFAKPMLQFIMDNFDIAYGANITSDALKVYLRMGFRFIKEVPRLVKIYDYKKISALGEISPTLKKVYRIQKESENVEKAYKIHSIDMISGDAVFNGFDRSSENLKWRYTDHPIYEYKVVELSQSKGESCSVIYRVEEVGGANIMIVTDILSSSNTLNLDFSALDNMAADEGFVMVEFYSTFNKINTALTIHGFIPLKELSDFINITHLYNPLEVKKSKSYSLIYYAKDEHSRLTVNYSDLYLSKSDCDLDRPNHKYLEKIGKDL